MSTKESLLKSIPVFTLQRKKAARENALRAFVNNQEYQLTKSKKILTEAILYRSLFLYKDQRVIQSTGSGF